MIKLKMYDNNRIYRMVDEDKSYWEKTLVYVNGEPADDVSLGLIPGTNQTIVNIEHYD